MNVFHEPPPLLSARARRQGNRDDRGIVVLSGQALGESIRSAVARDERRHEKLDRGLVVDQPDPNRNRFKSAERNTDADQTLVQHWYGTLGANRGHRVSVEVKASQVIVAVLLLLGGNVIR